MQAIAAAGTEGAGSSIPQPRLNPHTPRAHSKGCASRTPPPYRPRGRSFLVRRGKPDRHMLRLVEAPGTEGRWELQRLHQPQGSELQDAPGLRAGDSPSVPQVFRIGPCRRWRRRANHPVLPTSQLAGHHPGLPRRNRHATDADQGKRSLRESVGSIFRMTA
jgi:hypothetical protein